MKIFGEMPHRGFLPINSKFTNRIASNVNSFCRPITRINSTDSSTSGIVFAPAGRKSWEFLAIFRFFSGRKPPNIHGWAWNLAWRRGPAVPSTMPNFTLIRESCRPCGTKKNLKIACWVIAIPAVARPVTKSQAGGGGHYTVQGH